MIVVDIETSGVNPNKHSIVSIGAVDFLEPSRQFYEECRIWDGAHIMDESMSVHGFSRKEVSDENKKTEKEASKAFFAWAMDSENHTVAGQNPSFDISFLQAAAHRGHLDFPLPHRSIDLHSLCFFHMTKRGKEFPTKNGRTDLDSDKIMEYVGIPPEPKPHVAITGAIYEAEAISRLIRNQSMFDDFKDSPIPWLK